jgi:hypothetical protein
MGNFKKPMKAIKSTGEIAKLDHTIVNGVNSTRGKNFAGLIYRSFFVLDVTRRQAIFLRSPIIG